MRRVKSLISADNSAKLIRLGVGQKVKPRARTNNSSLESGVPPRETSSATKSEEKRMFSQAMLVEVRMYFDGTNPISGKGIQL